MHKWQAKLNLASVIISTLLVPTTACALNSPEAPLSPSRGLSWEKLEQLLAHSDPHLRAYAVYNVGYRFPHHAPTLLKFVSDPNPSVRRAAIFTLGLFPFEQGADQFAEALNDAHYGVRRAAVFALGNIKTPQSIEPLLGALHDEDAVVRQLAVLAIARAGRKEYVPRLIPMLKDDSPRVRRAAACGLGMLGDRSALEPLRQLYRDRRSSEPAEKIALSNNRVQRALKQNVNVGYEFLSFEETLQKLSTAAGVEITVDDEVLFTLNKSADDPHNLDSIRLAMWNVPFEKALTKVVETVGGYYYVESGTINIASRMYEYYDTPLSLEVPAAMALLGDRSALRQVRKFSNHSRFGMRARQLLSAASSRR